MVAEVVAKLLSEQEARLRKEFEHRDSQRNAEHRADRAELQAKLWERIAEIVKIEVERRPAIAGKDGAPGKDGSDGIISAEALADLHKGVWAATEYERGSLVTYSGSVFLALVKTTDKPETSEAWKLIVKRGRDGKDGKDGAKGEKGEQGPAGHWKGVE